MSFNVATVDVFVNHTSVTEIMIVVTTAMKSTAPPVSTDWLIIYHLLRRKTYDTLHGLPLHNNNSICSAPSTITDGVFDSQCELYAKWYKHVV